MRELVQLVMLGARVHGAQFFFATEYAEILIRTGSGESVEVHRCIPRAQHRCPGVFGHLLAVTASRPPLSLAAGLGDKAIGAPGDDEARDQPLDIPLPRR